MSKVSDIVVNTILEKVEEDGLMPWQQPYKYHNAFNYVSMRSYSGINRWLLPAGEYLTKKQIDEINKGRENPFLFQKGIRWYMVVFYTESDSKKLLEVPKGIDYSKAKVGDRLGYYDNDLLIYTGNGKCKIRRFIMRYYRVCERNFLKTKDGEMLPSRIDNEVEIKYFKPKEILDSYTQREGINVEYRGDIPHYNPNNDTLVLNNDTVSEEEYWDTAFHESIHSTGVEKRLNRAWFKNYEEFRAEEECLAEMGSALLCGECLGIKAEKLVDNQAAYIKSWSQFMKDKSSTFLSVASQAEKAFRFVMGDLVANERQEH